MRIENAVLVPCHASHEDAILVGQASPLPKTILADELSLRRST